jgi:hypothetical protein
MSALHLIYFSPFLRMFDNSLVKLILKVIELVIMLLPFIIELTHIVA